MAYNSTRLFFSHMSLYVDQLDGALLQAAGQMQIPPIPQSALEKDPRPGPLFEGNPVAEGTTRRGTATPVHRPQDPRVPHTARRGA